MYVIVGENAETLIIETFYAVCRSMTRADALCLEAENKDPARVYTWYEVNEEDG